ncbi:TAXI family TRAP transporter solute-binding subunit [Pararhodobacter zhoushanensis]|uniref:TAXI family TRAP transporter solute-binding subunit n=1 Tax=Pararhodobacter zhoushanensis TaxID=2479545 RepID=A0ABT3GTR5_9RHOB|nr:TAXI family TRAP transporter solute-binding subunit [Pararhodobacter zhoushanensis]MCW1930921.1 TAXI family TRAP transporter solute-binding subunit [Pararhodobacter zhoushanensis]
MKTVVFALSALLLALPAQQVSAQMVTVGTATPGSLFHSAGTAVAKIINDEAGIRAILQPFASANVYIPAISEGDIDFGVGTAHEVGVALEGREHFEGRPQEGLRALGVMFPLQFGMFVRADSDIQSIADLRGHTVPGGYSSQQIAATMMEAIYASVGMTEADVESVTVANTVGGADDFAAGRVDAFFFALGAAKVSEVDAAVGGVRVLPFGGTDEELAAIREFLPQAYFRQFDPRPGAPGITEPTTILAIDAIMFASASTSDDVVHDVTQAIYEHRDELIATFPAFRGFDPAMMARPLSPIEYHPGAVRFFNEVGIMPAAE